MYSEVFNAVMNTVFVSIPECFLWVVLVLLFLKRRDLLDVYRWEENLRKFLIPVIPTAICINLMRYILHINNLTNFIIIEAMMCCLVIHLIRKNNFLNEKINYLAIIIYVLLADFILIITTEGLSILIIISFMNITIDTVNNNIFLNIILSFIPRILQILILSLFIYKQNVGQAINYIEVILKNKILSICMGIFLLTVLTSSFIFERYVVAMNYFHNYIMIIKILLTFFIVLIPVILISSYIISIYNLLWINIKLQKEKDNMLNDIY